ncbi:MAG: polysaccharide deacetylase [Ramlibacter sp.]|nr:polysaccharide deacetylase [Ramlibacter sp.]
MTRPLLPRQTRYEYHPLPERKDYSWPGGKRLAFVMTTNVECFAFGAGNGHDPAKTGEPQTHRNYSWRDYGNRIGIWRFFELFDELRLPAAHNVNSLLYDYAPQVMDEIRRRGDEIVAHGRTNAENHRGMWEADEERIIQDVVATFVQHEGRAPAGWMGSGA